MSENVTVSKKVKSIWPMFVLGLLMIGLFAIVSKSLVVSGDRSLFDEEAIRSNERLDILDRVKADNLSQTTGYAWVDRDKGIVRIPAARAAEIMVGRLAKQGPPTPANKIDPATSQGSMVKPGGLATPLKPIPAFPTVTAPQPAPTTPQAEVPADDESPVTPKEGGGPQ